MELITTYICKQSDIGIHNNMFGGTILSIIDDASAAYVSQICDTQRVVTLKIDELIFVKPVHVGNILKVYGEVVEFGTTSITIYIEVRKHNVFTGLQSTVTHTKIKFVRIDDEGCPLHIHEFIKERYRERIKKYGRGLLDQKEIEREKIRKNERKTKHRRTTSQVQESNGAN
jgi:acyl-CoA thioesterase YciA